MINVLQLERSVSQEELENIKGSGPITNFALKQAISRVGALFGNEVVNSVNSVNLGAAGDSFSDGTLTGALTNPSGNFSFASGVTLTPFGT